MTLAAFARDAMSGRSGIEAAGRWHHAGRPVVYASQSPSLAALEVLARTELGDAPPNFAIIELDVPDELEAEECNPERISKDWRSRPAPLALRDFGTKWLGQGKRAVLSMPSAVMPLERNYLVNPLHPAARQIRVTATHPFSFDASLRK